VLQVVLLVPILLLTDLALELLTDAVLNGHVTLEVLAPRHSLATDVASVGILVLVDRLLVPPKVSAVSE